MRPRSPRESMQSVARALGRVRGVLHRVLGAPDYEAYLAHQRAHHPGGRALTAREFLDARLAQRYDRPGSRCC